MIDGISELIGMEESEALDAIRKSAFECSLIRYSSFRPVRDADCARVVRAREQNGTIELVTCAFKTEVSQG